MNEFQPVFPYEPKGDQPKAIAEITNGFLNGHKHITLLGVTGSGKTFTMANVIHRLNKPTIVISHNKTLAAQLFNEFRALFPKNSVEYFVSFYDYYQPEAYIPQTDTYIEKDSSINDEIDRLRLKATQSILTRRDVIIVASVSCIYGIGSPSLFREVVLEIRRGASLTRDEILQRLVSIQYERSDMDFGRSTFRVRGEIIDVFPSYEEFAYRIELFGDEVENISKIHPFTGERLEECSACVIYPAKHFMTTPTRRTEAIESIKRELSERLKELRSQGKTLEARRLDVRTNYDLEMIQEIGYCPGIENYSRHFDGRSPGEPPFTLLHYFPEDFFMIIDESHVTVPQLAGMYEGNWSRKQTLIEHGFRLPSAHDHRPLKFSEFESLINQVLYVSATPGPYELERSALVSEQIIRPTGLVDPRIEVLPTYGQTKDLISRIKERTSRKERVLVTTLTKRMAEDLAEYLNEEGVNVRYLHSEIDTLKRIEILRDLRLGEFDVLVGINLLREGLDLPEVSMVAILDADKEGFLRSETALIQVIGRTARHEHGEVVMYADTVTGSMRKAINETNRRRKLQIEYNKAHNIVPKTIKKVVKEVLVSPRPVVIGEARLRYKYKTQAELQGLIRELEREMKEAADRLDFERAAMIRDDLLELKNQRKKMKDDQKAIKRS
jgi:excinuclease ABC subunit B